MYFHSITDNINIPQSLPLSLKKEDIFYNIPVGILILKITNDTEPKSYEIEYSNNLSNIIFKLSPSSTNISKLKESFSSFKKWQNTSEQSTMNISNKQLIDLNFQIFNNELLNESSGIYISDKNMIFIKNKYTYNRILITADNITDDRKRLQEDLLQNINYQYLLTLYHEIYNPLNALNSIMENGGQPDTSVCNNGENYFCNTTQRYNINDSTKVNTDNYGMQKNSNSNFNSKCLKFNNSFSYNMLIRQESRIENSKKCLTLIDLIKLFIKNFILYIKVIIESYSGLFISHSHNIHPSNQLINKLSGKFNLSPDSNLTVTSYKGGNFYDTYLNLGFILKKIATKKEKILKYKDIRMSSDLSELNDKTIMTNYFYFKSLFKSIFIYIYITLNRNQEVKIKSECISSNHEEDNNIKINFLVIDHSFKENNMQQNKFFFPEGRSTTTIVEEIEFLYKKRYNAKSTIKTSEIEKDIIIKLANILNFEITINPHNENLPLISVSIPKNLFKNAKSEIVKINELEETNCLAKYNLFESDERKIEIKNINNINNTIIGLDLKKENSQKLYFGTKKSSLFKQKVSSNIECNYSENNINNNNYLITIENCNESLNNNIDMSIQQCPYIIPNSQSITQSNNLFLMSCKDEDSNNINEIQINSKNIINNNIKILKTLNNKVYDESNIVLINESDNERENHTQSNKFSKHTTNDVSIKKSYTKTNTSTNAYTNLQTKIKSKIKQNDKKINSDQKNKGSICEQNPSPSLPIHSQDPLPEEPFQRKFVSTKKMSYNNLNSNHFKTKKKMFGEGKKNLIDPPQKDITPKNRSQLIFNTPIIRCNCSQILICDDEKFMVEAIEKNFLMQGILCDKCYNGKECLDKIKEKYEKNCLVCKQRNYFLLILDINMPVLDGVSASKKIQKFIDNKEIDDVIKIIIISTSVDDRLKNDTSDLTCIKDYLKKPVKKSEWKNILDKYFYPFVK